MEFHIDDTVVDIKTGKRFVVTGIHKSNGEMLYFGEGQGWTPENSLDYDYDPPQREVLQEFDCTIHLIYGYANDLLPIMKKIRKVFPIGDTPRYVTKMFIDIEERLSLALGEGLDK